MNRACFTKNINLHEQNQHASSIRPLENNFVRMKKSSSIKIWQPIILIVIFSYLFAWSLEAGAMERPLIFPVPQQMQLNKDVFALDETITIVVPQNSSKNDIFLARFLVRELSDKYSIAVKIESRSVIPKDRKVVIMGRFSNPLIQAYCKENQIEVTEKTPGAEGYILQVSSNKVIIAGSDDQGAFYGLQSLRQLIDVGGGKEIQGLKVKDWPSFPFRAIRLYIPGPENIAFFKRFMRDFMSLYKYNKVIIE